jgi:hypothetical protein
MGSKQLQWDEEGGTEGERGKIHARGAYAHSPKEGGEDGGRAGRTDR